MIDIGNPGSARPIAVGDSVLDRAFFFPARVIGLHGPWAWLVVDDDPNFRPVTSLIADLIVTDEEQNQAA